MAIWECSARDCRWSGPHSGAFPWTCPRCGAPNARPRAAAAEICSSCNKLRAYCACRAQRTLFDEVEVAEAVGAGR